VVSMLLLVALVGALYLGKLRAETRKEQATAERPMEEQEVA
jgi:hypothetical protein